MLKIASIHAYEILDSRGYPTVEAEAVLDNGARVVTSVPETKPMFPNEPTDVRDEDANRFNGKGVLHAVSYINDLIAPKLKGVSPSKIFEIDDWLIQADGTKNKSRLGVNTLLTISQLMTMAGAVEAELPLFRYINALYTAKFKEEIAIDRAPTPIFNIINGGRHANSPLNFQEFQIIPSSSFTFASSYQKSIEVFTEIKKVLEYRNVSIAYGEIGGFSPNLTTNIDALEIIVETINQLKMKPGMDMFIGIDHASSHYFKNGLYTISDKAHALKTAEYAAFIKTILSSYSILSVEDPFDTEDWQSWKKLTASTGSTMYVVGDELTRMSKDKVEYASREEACTTILIKPNQAGTLTEVFEIVHTARDRKLSYIVAGRSSETNCHFIADLAVGLQSEFVKFGAPTRGERVAKYNRLWKIERDELHIS